MLSAAFAYLCQQTFGTLRGQDNRETSVDCPRCADIHNGGEPDGKGNLAINRHKHFFKCWKCDYKGSLSYLFSRHAPRELWEQFRHELEEPDRITPLLNPWQPEEKERPPLELPAHFTPFFSPCGRIYRGEALNYLLGERGLTLKQIQYYRLGFCSSGPYAGRIIFPSYDREGQLNYFVSRMYRKSSDPAYKNPDQDKNSIIFGEDRLNWDAPVILTEGPFDLVVFPNSALLMGKLPGAALLKKLALLKPPVIIALDPDAWEDAQKLGLLLENLGLCVRVLDLRPYGDRDPSQLHKEEGVAILQQALKHNLKEVDFSTIDLLH